MIDYVCTNCNTYFSVPYHGLHLCPGCKTRVEVKDESEIPLIAPSESIGQLQDEEMQDQTGDSSKTYQQYETASNKFLTSDIVLPNHLEFYLDLVPMCILLGPD